ncbi:MAG: hypothetical protein ACXVXB_09535, partial [Nocardioidaceae bacterium]
LLALTALLAVATPTAVPAAADASRPDGPQPYFAPPFRSSCTVHHYGEGEAPDPATTTDDPLCVEYSKRDITLDDGGAVRFLQAEPARFAVAGDKCAYWQQDHWSVQASRGQTPVVRWDGSYWFDKGTGQAGARLRGFAVGGRPATLRQAAAAVAPYSPQLAAYLRSYSHGGDGMGYSGSYPFDPTCA